jgi:hypothetical protein
MIEEHRVASIVDCVRAMRQLGTDAVIDFFIKIGSPPDVMGCLLAAILMKDQDKFILGLPVAGVHEESPEIIDQMVAIRIPIEPVVPQPVDSGGDMAGISNLIKALPCKEDPLTLEPEWGP